MQIEIHKNIHNFVLIDIQGIGITMWSICVHASGGSDFRIKNEPQAEQLGLPICQEQLHLKISQL